MRKPTSPNILEVIDDASVDLDGNLDSLGSEYQEWLKVDGRGNKQLWSLLGKVYELGAGIEQNAAARSGLIKKVNQHPNVAGNNRWRADKKSPEELLLTLLLGVKEDTKATKSQWLSAIRAAKKMDVSATQTAFAAWLEEVGGVNSARKSVGIKNSTKDESLRSLIGKLETFNDRDQQTVRIPEPIYGSGYPENIGLVIVQRIEDHLNAKPIATLVNEKLIVRAIKTLLGDATRAEREFQRGMKAAAKQRESDAKPDWKRFVKSGDFVGTLAEYVHEGSPTF